MRKTPTLSIIVPSKTGRVDFLKAQLSQQTFKNWELIISAGYPSPPLARNQGAQRAQCPFFLFLDDDIHFSHKNFLAKIVESLMTIAPRSVLGVKWTVPPDATEFQKNLYRNSFHQTHDPKEPLRVVPWLDSIAGCCMAMRRDTFEMLGGFDERLISGADPEFFYRAWRDGGKTYMLSSVWVYHYPPSSPKVLFKKSSWYARGNAQVAKMHPEANYRPALRNIWHAASLLLLHTLALVPLMFVKISFHNRRPQFSFRPLLALNTYTAFWTYCIAWFTLPELSQNPPSFLKREPSEKMEMALAGDPS